MFQKFENVFATKSCGNFPNLTSALDYIRGVDRNDLDVINNLRSLHKGSTESDEIKRSLPAIIWNSNTTGSRKKDCVTNSTGYFYFDIDGVDSYDFNKDYFCAFWKSVTNTGYGALVQVSGVDANNFDLAYKEVATSLNIPFDPNAKDIVRLNFLSYDPNLYFNDRSEIIDCSYLSKESDLEEEINEKCQTVDKNTFLKSSDCDDTFPKLRYDNLEEKKAKLKLIYDSNGVCDLKDNKINFTQIHIPKIIYDGSRYKSLTTIGIHLLMLNPMVSLKQFTSFIYQINKSQCQPPKDFASIKSFCEKLFKRKVNLILTSNKTRRFFFNVQMDISDKRSLVLSYIRKENSVQKKKAIMDALQSLIILNKPFKIVDVMRKASAARNTVNKYLKDIISESPQLNLELLTTKKYK